MAIGSILVIFSGRMGNQLWQLAVGCVIAERLRIPLRVNDTVYPTAKCQIDFTYMPNLASKFVLCTDTAAPGDLIIGGEGKEIQRLSIEDTIALAHATNTKQTKTMTKTRLVLSGYWECYKNIVSYWWLIQSWFTPVTALTPGRTKPKTTIYLRMGDVRHIFAPLLPAIGIFLVTLMAKKLIPDSRMQAMQIVVEDTKGEVETAWFKTLREKGSEFEAAQLVTYDSHIQAFEEISSSSVIVCLDSTFSWWAAALSQARVYVAYSEARAISAHRIDMYRNPKPSQMMVWDLDRYKFMDKDPLPSTSHSTITMDVA